MSVNQKRFWSGTTIAIIYWLCSEMFNPAFSLYVSGLGFDGFKISLLFAAQTFFAFVFTIQIGSLADRIGQNNMILIGAGAMIMGGILLLISNNYLVLLVVEVIIGLGHITVWLSSQSVVTLITGKSREQSIANMTALTALGQLAGPLIYGFTSGKIGYKACFYIYIVFSILIIIMYPLIPKRQVKKSIDKNSSLIGMYAEGGKLFKDSKGVRVSTVISFSLAFILYLRSTYLPIYLDDIGFSSATCGLLIAAWSFASIIVRPVSAKLISNLGRYMVTSIALLFSVSGLVIIGITQLLPIVLLGILIIGLGTGFNQPLAISLVTYSTNDENRSLGMGIRLMSNRLANWICPLVVGYISAFIPMGVTYIIVAIPLSGISGYSLTMLKKLITIHPQIDGRVKTHREA